MPDLSTLMHGAADQAGPREVDIDVVVERGNRMRVRRTVARVAGPAVAALAVALVLPNLGQDTIQFLPTPEAPAIGSPPGGQVSEEPEDERELRTPARNRRASSRLHGGSDFADAAGGGSQYPAGAAANADGVVREATDDAYPRGDLPGGLPEGPADDEVVTARDPRRTTGPTPNDDTPSPPQTPDDPPPGPPRQRYCDVAGSQLDPGDSASCAFTATTAGGFNVHNNFGSMRHPVPDEAPLYWEIAVSRGSQTFHYDSHNTTDACGAPDLIQSGDVVNVTVHRPEPPDDAWTFDVYVGWARHCY